MYQGYIAKAKTARAIAELHYIDGAIQAYYIATKTIPTLSPTWELPATTAWILGEAPINIC
jgi:hypothetical protein